MPRAEQNGPDSTIEAARINRRGVVLVSVIGAVATISAALIGYLATRSSVVGQPTPEPSVTVPRVTTGETPSGQREPSSQEEVPEQGEPLGEEIRLEVRLGLNEGVDVDVRQELGQPADGATGGIDVFLGGGLGFSQLTVSGDGVYAAKATDIPPANQARSRCPQVVANSTPSPYGVVPVASVSTCFVTSEGRVAWLTINSVAPDGSEAVIDIRAWDT